MKQLLKFLWKLNIKTIYFNFKYLEFKQAIKFPFLISNKVFLRQMDGKIRLDCPISRGLIEIGYGNIGIFDDKKSRSIWEVSGLVIFKGKAIIGHGSKISVGDSGTLEFGKNFKITAESSIVTFSKITFGNDCLLSWDILIMDTDFHIIKNSQNNIINEPRPIVFGNNIWVCCQCMILKGSVIPDNCVIGAKSLVTKKLEVENALYVGNPVKIAKRDIVWKP